MSPVFADLVSRLEEKYQQLMAMEPVTVATLPKETPVGGVYLFSSEGENLYAGRTKRKLGERIKDHVSAADDCPFAWRLAREATGNLKATYKAAGSRNDLLKQPAFREAYEGAKVQIKRMQVRYVGEDDPLRQALLEIYVAVVTDAKHNDFDTH